MNTINGIWHPQRTGILRAAMIDGWMTVTKRPSSFSWQVTCRAVVVKGIADTQQQAMDDAEKAYANLHKGAQS